MEIKSSPQLIKLKTQKNKQRTNNEPLNNSVELPGWNTIKKYLTKKKNQWNCRGIRANYKELLLLLNKYNPKVVCLQETFHKD